MVLFVRRFTCRSLWPRSDALLVGMAIGLVNGINVSILGLPPFIATLAMMMVAEGLALIISDKASISIAAATSTLPPRHAITRCQRCHHLRGPHGHWRPSS